MALRRGTSKEALLSCDWAAVKPSPGDLAEWPLLQSISATPPDGFAVGPAPAFCHADAAAATTATAAAAATAAATIAPAVPLPDGGVEERKESQERKERQLVLLDTNGDHANAKGNEYGGLKEQRDEWIAVIPNAPAGGVLLRDAPNDSATTGSWRLAPGQIAQLVPPQERSHPEKQERNKGSMAAEAEAAEWRRVVHPGGESSWLAPTNVERGGSDDDRCPLERYEAHRYLMDGFSVWARCGGSVTLDGVCRSATSGQTVALEEFWVPIRRGGRATAAESGTSVPSPFSAAQLQGDSDALLLSAADVAGLMSQGSRDGDSGDGVGGIDGEECNSLMVVGKWKIGLVTDTLTVTTRTSGFMRIVLSPAANADADGRDKSAAAAAAATAAPTSSRSPHASDNGATAVAASNQPTSSDEVLPLLVDGLVFGFRAADGLLTVGRAIPTAGPGETKGWGAQMNLVEPRAAAYLGGVDEGAEVIFSVIDAGEDVMFSCREAGGRRRAATVRARCRDNWGRGRVAFGTRGTLQDASTGWLRVVSQAHGATVRSGMSIDADAVVGRIPCGTVVPYDRAVIYTSPGVQDQVGIDPVVRYRCIATATTPAGWISERGRYANHPYRICEPVKWRPRQPIHLLSHVSIGDICVPSTPSAGTVTLSSSMDASTTSLVEGLPLPRPRRGILCESGLEEWQQRLGELSTLSARFHLVQRLNRGVSQALPFVDFSQGELRWSLAALLSRCRHLIFSSLKLELWHTELARTERPVSIQDNSSGPPPPLELRLSRGRAARNMRSGNGPNGVAEIERRTLFGQAFHALRDAPMEAFRLRPGEALYTTVFVGEHAHDAGGKSCLRRKYALGTYISSDNIRVCRCVVQFYSILLKCCTFVGFAPLQAQCFPRAWV